MAKSLYILIWICSCITSLTIATQNVTLDVILGNQPYKIIFGEQQFVKFHTCLCGSDYGVCFSDLENASSGSDAALVRYLMVQNRSLWVGKVVGTKGRTFKCSLNMTEPPWRIGCGQFGFEPRSCPASSSQCLMLNNTGNKNCSYKYQSLYLIWNSSQTLTFQDQSNFNAELTHCQCDSPSHTSATVSSRPSTLVYQSNSTSTVKGSSQNRDNNEDDKMFIFIGVGSVAFMVVVVVVIVVIVVKRRKDSRHARRDHSVTVGLPDGYEHYSVIADFSSASSRALSVASADARAEQQSVNQGSSSLSQNGPADEEFSQSSRVLLQEPSERTVYSKASPSSHSDISATGNTTYARLHEIRRCKVDVYDVLPETS